MLSDKVPPLVSWTAIGTTYTSMFSNNQRLWMEATGMTMPVSISKPPREHFMQIWKWRLLKQHLLKCAKKKEGKSESTTFCHIYFNILFDAHSMDKMHPAVTAWNDRQWIFLLAVGVVASQWLSQ